MTNHEGYDLNFHIIIGHYITDFMLLIILDILIFHMYLFNKFVPAITGCSL